MKIDIKKVDVKELDKVIRIEEEAWRWENIKQFELDWI